MISQMETLEAEPVLEQPPLPPFVVYLTIFVTWSNRFLVPCYVYSMCVDLPHPQFYALRGMVCFMCLMFQGLMVGLNKQAARGEVHSDCKSRLQVVGLIAMLCIMTPLFAIVSLLDGNYVIAVVFVLNCLALSAVYLWIIQWPLKQAGVTTGCSDSELILFLLFGVVLFAFGTFKAYNLLKVEALQLLQNNTFPQ